MPGPITRPSSSPAAAPALDDVPPAAVALVAAGRAGSSHASTSARARSARNEPSATLTAMRLAALVLAMLALGAVPAAVSACNADDACGCLCTPEPDGDPVAPCSTGFAPDLDAPSQDEKADGE